MHTITCPHCHETFELSDALTHDIEERIRTEQAQTIKELRLKADEAEELKAKQEERIAAVRHELKMELNEAAAKEKEKLFEQIEALQQRQRQNDEQKRLEIEKAVDEAKEQARHDAQIMLQKRIEEAKAEALGKQSGELEKMKLQLEMASQNAKSQKESFDEMLQEQRRLSDEQKLQQKKFFDEQIAQQKEAYERDVAQRERELVSKTRLESELKIKEQEEMIRKLGDQVNAMKETADNRSQQLQGEALEVLIEEQLMRHSAFRLDLFSEVKKGANGVDINMTVRNAQEEDCGLIMIEAKRAANWSEGWVAKIKKDRIESGAKEALCLIVSTRLKRDDILVDDLGEGIWASVPEYFIHFIQIVRKNMEEMHRLQKSNIDRGDKKELLYNYVLSEAFRAKVKAMNDYHEEIYSQGVKIQRNMKKMLDTIVKSKDMGDDLFIELGNRANVGLLPGMDEALELVDMKSGAHKNKSLLEGSNE